MDDGPGGPQGVHTAAHVQVEIESEELRQAATGPASAEAMLDLEPPQVVRTEDTGLAQQLTHQPLDTDEGKYSRCSNVYSWPFVLPPVCAGVSSLSVSVPVCVCV